MARGSESTADLYVRLGLSYDELESGFVNAERTIRDNMTRLSRENQIIDLQARVEIAGLDETADAEQILQIRTRALNQQLEHQRDRVRLASAELANMTDRTGENSDQTQRARLALERERLALVQLEEQLASLNETQEDTSEGFGGLDSILDRIPPEVKMVGSAFIGVTTAMIAAGAASKELIEKWRELQNTSYNLNMSVNDTENFLRHMKLAGGEIDDFMGYVRGITDAWTKGEWDDPEFLTLRKWGATIVDATGRLKNFQDITEEVYQAYLKAKAAGEEIEFLQLTGGESGVTDAIQYFERYAEAKEDAAKIFDAGLDPDEMHDAERSLNLLAMQMDEFKDAAVDLITPATTQAMKGLFDVFRAGTEIIADNKDELRKWASSFALATAQAIGGKPLASVLFTAEDEKGLDSHTKKVLEAGQNLERAHAKLKAQIEGDPTTQYGWQRLTNLRDEIDDINAEIEHFNNDYDLSIAQLELWRERALRQNDLSKKERQAIEEDFSAQLEQIEQDRAQAIKEAREDVAAELGTELDQQLLDLQRQKKDWISAGMDAAEAEILTEKLKADAIEELEEEFAEERDSIRNTDLQNQLDAIDKAKDAWIDKGISEAAATALAEEQKAQAIEDFNDEVAEKLGSIYQTSLEQRLAQIEKEKQAWIDKGVEEVKATQWAEQAKVDAQRNAAMSVLKSQLEEYRAFRDYGYEGLKEYRLNELFKSGIRSEDLRMTPQQLEAFQKAQDTVERNLLPNFRTNYDSDESRRLIDNAFVDRQRQLREEYEKIAAGMTIGGKQVQITPEDEPYLGLVPREKLDEMYQPVNRTAEEFQQLIPELDGARQKLEEFSAVEQPTVDIPAPVIQELDTSALNQPFADVTEMFVAMSSALDDVTGKITDLGTIISEAIENIPQVDSAVETPDLAVDTSQIFSAFEELVSPMSEVNSQFGEMSNKLIEVTSGLSELVGALNNLQTQPQAQQQPQVVTPPPNITVTVQIEEAHAWDSEHIQELTDKVADKITPELIRAIGGDSNGY